MKHCYEFDTELDLEHPCKTCGQRRTVNTALKHTRTLDHTFSPGTFWPGMRLRSTIFFTDGRAWKGWTVIGLDEDAMTVTFVRLSFFRALLAHLSALALRWALLRAR